MWHEAKPVRYSQHSGQKFWDSSINPNRHLRSQLDGSPDQKRSRLDISRYLLSRYDDDPEELMDRVVTQDQTITLIRILKSKACSGSTLVHPLLRNSREFLQQRRWWPLWDNQGGLSWGRSHNKRCILCRRTEAATSRDCEEEERKVDQRHSALVG